MRKRKKWVPPQPLWYKVDPTDKRKLILKNGTRIKLSVEDVYTSEGGKVYTLTYRGLCSKTISYCKKLNYGKRTRGGTTQGQRYPYIMFRGKKYEVHVLVALAWIGKRKDGEEVDHITGNIRDIRVINLRIIPKEENHWCAGILKRLRRLSKLYHLPLMHPANRTPEDMLDLFKRFKDRPIQEAIAEELRRQRVLHAFLQASRDLHDPSLDPRRMSMVSKEKLLRHYRVEDPSARMEYEMTHHMEC